MGIHLALLQTDIKFCDFEYNAAHVKEMIADVYKRQIQSFPFAAGAQAATRLTPAVFAGIINIRADEKRG